MSQIFILVSTVLSFASKPEGQKKLFSAFLTYATESLHKTISSLIDLLLII